MASPPGCLHHCRPCRQQSARSISTKRQHQSASRHCTPARSLSFGGLSVLSSRGQCLRTPIVSASASYRFADVPRAPCIGQSTSAIGAATAARQSVAAIKRMRIRIRRASVLAECHPGDFNGPRAPDFAVLDHRLSGDSWLREGKNVGRSAPVDCGFVSTEPRKPKNWSG